MNILTNTTRMKLIRIFPHLFIIGLISILCSQVLAQPARKKNAPPPDAPISIQEAQELEAVIKTEVGEMRMEFFPAKAPLHVSAFIKRARAGFYDGSNFFRVIKNALIQGGDPTVKDSLPRNRWGTGYLNLLKDEFSDLKHERGTVSAVRLPDRPNSGGAQFFLCAMPQPQLDGQYTAFGLINEGLEIIDQIANVEADSNKFALRPIKIISIKIEPKKLEPFKEASVAEMRKEVILKTSLGDITLAMDPDLAPEHVRNFLKLVETGYYDRTAIHRIRAGFVVQAGLGRTRDPNPFHPADRWVRPLNGEFSKERKHIRGVLSMARTDDPNSALTSFFIVLRDAPNLDGQYSIFGKMVDGFHILDQLEQVPVQDETPLQRIEIIEAVIKP